MTRRKQLNNANSAVLNRKFPSQSRSHFFVSGFTLGARIIIEVMNTELE